MPSADAPDRSTAPSPTLDPHDEVEAFRAAATTPGQRGPALPRAPDIAARLHRAGCTAAALEVLDIAEENSSGGALRARLSAERLSIRLDDGDVPAELTGVIGDLLAVADERLAKGDRRGAADWLRYALGLTLHRTLHADDLVSPLATDARGWMAPFKHAHVYRALRPTRRAHLNRRLSSLRRGRLVHSPHRVLAVTGHGFHFLEEPLAHIAARADVELRRLDVRSEPHADRLQDLRILTRARLESAIGPTPAPPETELTAETAEALEWADTVVVEWCDNAAVWASLTVPAPTRLVIRLHSIEALSMSVHLVDWSRVDRLIFVAPHLRRLARAAVPVLRGVPTSVLPNATLLADIPRTKVPEAARTLALIGWGQAVKDPLYALEILGRLRLSDDSWRLLLVGNPFPEHDRTRSEAYRDRVQERLARADLAGAVDLVAWTPDLTELFSRVGFILSTSLRESFHISLIQAAASGAVPVVRDWPVVAAYGGPSSFLPKDWVIRTPAEAAARILDYADPARRSEAGEVASHWVRKRYDWGRVARSYDDVLLGR